MNLAYFLTQAARRFPNRSALIRGERSWSWRELDARVSALAAALARHGVHKGDCVLVHMRNGNEIVEAMFACFRLGAAWVPTNFRLLPDDIVHLAITADAKVFLCDADSAAHASAVRNALHGLALVVRIGRGPVEGSDYENLIDGELGAAMPDTPVEYDDPAWLFFTSGTTGRPKGAVLTHGQLGFVITNHLCDLMPGLTELDCSLAVAPLSHGAGLHLMTQVARAVPTILPFGSGFDPGEVWRLVAEHRVTNVFTVPTILKMLCEHPAVDGHDHSSLRYVVYAGAPMYREDQKRALAKLGPVLVQYYGLGEVSGNITVLPPALHHVEDGPQARVGTCGFERTAMQVSIQDDAGREVARGETGEICVCGLGVFAGYYNDPAANKKAFRDGWFRTGDLGYMDEDGFIYLTGRSSDMYISGGSNVYPREIEEKILAHPAVAEVAVVGVPDPTWGEVGVAVCVLRSGETVNEMSLIGWMEGKIARYKVPKRVFFWDALPKSGYGKITKNLVRAELTARTGFTFSKVLSVAPSKDDAN